MGGKSQMGLVHIRQRYFGVSFRYGIARTVERLCASEDVLPVNPLEKTVSLVRVNVMNICLRVRYSIHGLHRCHPQINAKWGENDISGKLLPMSLRTQLMSYTHMGIYTIVKSLYHRPNSMEGYNGQWFCSC